MMTNRNLIQLLLMNGNLDKEVCVEDGNGVVMEIHWVEPTGNFDEQENEPTAIIKCKYYE